MKKGLNQKMNPVKVKTGKNQTAPPAGRISEHGLNQKACTPRNNSGGGDGRRAAGDKTASKTKAVMDTILGKRNKG